MNRAAAALLLIPGAAVALSVMACRTPLDHVPSRPAHHSSTETAAPTSHPNTHGSYSSGHSTHTAKPPRTTPAASSSTGVPRTRPATTPVSTRPPVVHTSPPALTTAHLTSAPPPKGGIGTVLARTGSSAGQELGVGGAALVSGAGLLLGAGALKRRGRHS